MLRVATRFREACRPGPVWRRSARLHPWLDRSATRTIPASFAERATFLGGEKLLSFVIGTGRCGSSWVTEGIARHPEVGFVSGLDDTLPGLELPGRWNNALFRRSSPREPGLVTFRHRSRYLERGRLRVAPSEGWNLLERQVSPLLPSTRRDLLASDLTPWLEQRLRGFFERRMRAQGRRMFVHHVTGWPRAGLLQAAFPDARFVHVIRDGRAVASSWLQMPWWSGFEGPSNWSLGPLPAAYSSEWERSGRSFVVLAGLGWKLLMDAFDAARMAMPPRQWLDVRSGSCWPGSRPTACCRARCPGRSTRRGWPGSATGSSRSTRSESSTTATTRASRPSRSARTGLAGTCSAMAVPAGRPSPTCPSACGRCSPRSTGRTRP